MMIRDVAIVGAGFSGSLLAINLLRHDGPRATLIERAPAIGTGVAYGAAHPAHVLNVRAANMSAFPDDPGHFVRWLEARGVAGAGAAFVQRTVYGDYLRALLDEARATAADRLTVVAGDAVDLVPDDPVGVRLAGGGVVRADAAVLAVGNLPPHVPPGLGALEGSARYRANPWASDIATGLGDDDIVLLVGTGLTMIDVALALEARGFGGRIVAMSRRGLIPRRHEAGAPNPGPIAERPRGRLSALTREVRARGDRIGWRNAVDELRPFTQMIWGQAEAAERSRFLRHLRPWWDVHRHRLAPAVADRLAASIASGLLTVVAGKTHDVREVDGGVELAWRPRGADVVETLTVQRIVNCTGPQGDLHRTDEPLLAAMVGRGAIRPDAEHLGIDVDSTGRAIAANGTRNDRVFALGPMTRGAFWEIVAVPDIRRQAWDLARYLSNAHWVGGEGL
jgi:uncharacterized NAD(P)/FAD-binding protein YdhS